MNPDCVCSWGERGLRLFMWRMNTAPMTPGQRDWCLDEIAAVEGFDRSDYADRPDHELAGGVFEAWVDFCRDKGLL